MNLSELNSRFGLPGALVFEDGPGGMTMARIATAQGESLISVSGGNVMTWNPAGEKPVLWLSGFAKFAQGKSIRGGVPVCWPWFGPHATESSFPGHGFGRTAPWNVVATEAKPDGVISITLTLEQSEATRAQWPHASSVSLTVNVGRELGLALATRNLGTEAFVLGEALHTYFTVGDVRQAPVTGLSGCAFVDKVEGGARKVQEGDIVIGSEVDRVYVDTEAECSIEDASMNRRIRIQKTGSRSTVVWNPWIAKAEKMGDFGPDGHLGMVCVETCNAQDNVITLEPGAEHVMTCTYSVEALA